MLDIKFIRENSELVAAAAGKKHVGFDVQELIKIDDERLAETKVVEGLRAEQNKIGERVAANQNSAERDELIGKMRQFKDHLKEKEERLQKIMKVWRERMLEVPNIPDISVPEGAGEKDNVEVRRAGERPKFDFEPKSHIELMTALDWADFERGVTVAGFRGYFLKNEAVALAMALWKLFLDRLTEKGFTAMLAPSLVRRENLLGTGYLPQGEDELYRVGETEYLAGTAEVAVMGYLADEILAEKDLPKKFVAFSPCFRKEAGSYGKDTKGLVRVHEFYKVEQVVLCRSDHEESVRWHEELTKNTEDILQALKLPYRVVILCGGDMSRPAVKTYDIETWMPSENRYRETHSSSYYHDFQTRRLNIRYKDAGGKLRYAHSLNNTAAATPRLLAALVENFQQADGTIAIPEVLRPYLGNGFDNHAR